MSSAANDHNVVTNAPLTVETIEEGTTIKKTTGSVLHATMSTSLGEPNATVVVKPKKGTLKPTNHRSETTTAQAIDANDRNRNVTDATIGNAPPVATLTSHSGRNATVVESRNQAVVKDDHVEASQIVANEEEEILTDVEETAIEAVGLAETEEEEILTDVEETATEAVDSVETEEEEILTDAEETATEAVDSVEIAEEEILTDVVETATEAVDLVATEMVVMTGVTLDEVVQTVTVMMNAPMSAIVKPEENVQDMHTTEDLNRFVLDAIKTKIETNEVNGRDSRSPLLGCA